MFAAIYEFKTHPNQVLEFIEAWEALTLLLREYEGALGSRLHQQGDNNFIAYAQWPSLEIYEAAGNNLPEHATHWREKMRKACESITTLHQLNVVKDLLIHPSK
ncbi:MAG: antibiotic biosynthesis monooxygenase [Saprospiraceae bacterium]|nr:antibiotic biosynthesis monooxygenase [Saprospiraceae bacterium]